MDVNLADQLARERRARLAAERLLDLKQKELIAANEQLSRHALVLSGEIVEKREEVESVLHEKSRALEDLQVARQAMDIAKKRLWNSVETIQDGFAVFDASDALVVANPAYLSVFDGMEIVGPGISYEEILRILADEGIVNTEGMSRGEWIASMLERWQAPKIPPRAIQFWDGRYVRLLDRRTQTGDTVSLALDITEQIRREKELKEALGRAEAASRAKSAFLAKMSHELRTPMNGVVGMADMLMETPLDEEQRLFVDTIRNSGETLLGLINDVLDFSKMEAGKLSLHEAEFDLEKLLSEVLLLFQPAVLARRIELNLDYDIFMPARFIGDAGRIRQILTNLIGNAVKFTEQGHVTIRLVGVPQGEGRPMRVHVSIEDTGPGIPPDKIEHIFGEFNQVEDEHNRRHEGTGLGLAICKQLVSLMGGEIWADSEPGKGANFGFWLPLEQPAGESFELRGLPGWIERIVMVSRPSEAARIVANQLRMLGLQVQEVARDAFIAAPFAPQDGVIIIDQEPGLDEEACMRRALEGLEGEAPVILLNPGTPGEHAHAQSGRLLELRKPLSRHHLLEAMHRLDAPSPAMRTPDAPAETHRPDPGSDQAQDDPRDIGAPHPVPPDAAPGGDPAHDGVPEAAADAPEAANGPADSPGGKASAPDPEPVSDPASATLKMQAEETLPGPVTEPAEEPMPDAMGMAAQVPLPAEGISAPQQSAIPDQPAAAQPAAAEGAPGADAAPAGTPLPNQEDSKHEAAGTGTAAPRETDTGDSAPGHGRASAGMAHGDGAAGSGAAPGQPDTRQDTAAPRAEPAAERAAPPAMPENGEPGRRMRILAAEDNRTNRLVMSKMLGKLDIDLEFAENGIEAVEKWAAFKPDLVFMDISMPMMDGKEATRRIREDERENGLPHTPIVAITAHALSGDEDEILQAGLDHYLTKPLKKQELLKKIALALPSDARPPVAEADAAAGPQAVS